MEWLEHCCCCWGKGTGFEQTGILEATEVIVTAMYLSSSSFSSQTLDQSNHDLSQFCLKNFKNFFPQVDQAPKHTELCP